MKRRSAHFLDVGLGFSADPALHHAGLIDQGHHPYVRPLQTDWEADPTAFRARSSDPHRFEVICSGCGDGDGPTEFQPEPARLLRGPYPTRRQAWRIARLHEIATRPSAATVRRARRRELIRRFDEARREKRGRRPNRQEGTSPPR